MFYIVYAYCIYCMESFFKYIQGRISLISSIDTCFFYKHIKSRDQAGLCLWYYKFKARLMLVICLIFENPVVSKKLLEQELCCIVCISRGLATDESEQRTHSSEAFGWIFLTSHEMGRQKKPIKCLVCIRSSVRRPNQAHEYA